MINTAINHPGFQIISNHIFAEVLQNAVTGQKSLHSLFFFNSGDIISTFSAAQVFANPHYLTVQTGSATHITLNPAFLQYINHSCNPNVFFDTSVMQLIALRNIDPNEEFSFFYPSAELDMAQPFICYCGSKNCLQNIKGARFISKDILKKYRLTHFIEQELLL